MAEFRENQTSDQTSDQTSEQTAEQIRNGPHKETLTPVEARQGKKIGAMRYVLGVSIALTVIAFVVVYFFIP